MRHGICKASQSQQLRLELGPAGRLGIRMDAEMLRMDSISLTIRVSKMRTPLIIVFGQG